MRIGRWSELSVVRVDQVAVSARSGVDMERSGEVGEEFDGTRVGELVFKVSEED
jgi:hypothetical protein